MNTRVIDDPSTVGWELDPDTGRWMWTGAGSGGGSAGAGMVIQPTEPTEPVTGLQWMDSTTGRIWIWDEDKWLEFPAGGSADAGGAGGGAWEFLVEFPMSGVSMIDYPHMTDEFSAYRLHAEGVQGVENGNYLDIQFYEGGNLVASGYDRKQLLPDSQQLATNQPEIRFPLNSTYGGDFGRYDIKFFGTGTWRHETRDTFFHVICEGGNGKGDQGYCLRTGSLKSTTGNFTGFRAMVSGEFIGTFRLYGWRS